MRHRLSPPAFRTHNYTNQRLGNTKVILAGLNNSVLQLLYQNLIKVQMLQETKLNSATDPGRVRLTCWTRSVPPRAHYCNIIKEFSQCIKVTSEPMHLKPAELCNLRYLFTITLVQMDHTARTDVTWSPQHRHTRRQEADVTFLKH